MKSTVVFITLFMGAVCTSKAQFTKGTIMLGGTLSEQSVTDKSKNGSGATVTDETRNVLIVAPQAGYFLTNHFALGTGLSYSRYRISDPVKSVDHSIVIAPFARYYISQLFLQATTTFFTGANGSSNYNAGLGYAILLNKSVAIEPQLGYSYEKLNNADYSNSGIFLKVGIQFYLPK
jgi:hypothetical protein